jgi:predicted HicB family RNase H-like nuclease
MKRIVNGVTYNTETSTRLAESQWEPNISMKVFATLYQTRGGAFFADNETTREEWNEIERTAETKVTRSFEPMSPEDAHKWILSGDVEIFHNPFDDPPEASAEAEPGATIYIRVPASLKQRVDETAKKNKVSGNQWAMRCVEKCLAEPDLSDFRELAYIWQISATPRISDEWTLKKCLSALEQIAQYTENLAERLLGEKALDDVGVQFMGDREFEAIRNVFSSH